MVSREGNNETPFLGPETVTWPDNPLWWYSSNWWDWDVPYTTAGGWDLDLNGSPPWRSMELIWQWMNENNVIDSVRYCYINLSPSSAILHDLQSITAHDNFRSSFSPSSSSSPSFCLSLSEIWITLNSGRVPITNQPINLNPWPRSRLMRNPLSVQSLGDPPTNRLLFHPCTTSSRWHGDQFLIKLPLFPT